MDGKAVGGVVVLALVIAVFLGRGMLARDNFESKYLTEAYALVEHCDKYRKHQGYIIGICESAHEAAFQKAYTAGSRRRKAKFDENRYYPEFFRVMRERAITDGQYEVAESVTKLAEDFATGKVTLVPG
ncbi:MAG: hypothetical protein KF699_14510 [Phycisphaeraceae bacterium]|nr:hypothetical protein [Phycisphaeraceae bacterium]MBX3407470.1 hypothetical protein [Phycisphaeraceae bacterium]